MKIIILKESLQKSLNIFSRIISKSATLPILSNVLIGSEKNFLTISATDLEMGIKRWVLSKTEKPGEVAVPWSVLSGVASFFSKNPITIESQELLLKISSDNFSVNIKCLSAEDFPVIPDLKSGTEFFVPSVVFREALSQVCDLASLSSARPEISGVYFVASENTLRVVATDSFRLAEKTVFLEKKTGLAKEISFILPQKTAKEIVNIFEGDGIDDLKIVFDQNQLLVESSMTETAHPETRLASKLLDGEYPNYKEVIPQKYDTQAILNRVEFLNQIKLASLFCGKTNEVKLSVDDKGGVVGVYSQNQDVGEHSSFVPGRIKGKYGEASFNYRFLLDGLLKIKSSEIALELSARNGSLGPGVLRPIGDQSYVYVLMPLNA
ncbi:MAG: DNA polymerase III subunit beta [Candidatus Wildermuthbacteria bacterium RIFCSPHIGHO2_12_FULL_40_12]|uniref:Beta sliding clamp n=1 Tax=Candidatus Wildermuthbacteria bacterium RIFCSPHIGHO2_12_FULL_40_12 TaxID=1802457 RepID=A0A1G2RCE7_9BACT|nr:MAG: DNA polymerase III subunit beta [Candidatus Wildermuthbacteria bacterium RIFCSPHIGHO2_12_FULL_40_12]